MTGDPIERFSGDHDFLSNFYPSLVTYEGETYGSGEHAFQAAKTLDPAERQRIKLEQSPGQAKRIGRAVTLRAGWDDMRIDVMREVLASKFEDPDLRARLLATGERRLIEGNTWNDRFWGVCRGSGQNHLGKLLMELRAKLARNGD